MISAAAEEDKDVEFLYESGPITCQFCSASLHALLPVERQAHYELHFADAQCGDVPVLNIPCLTGNTAAPSGFSTSSTAQSKQTPKSRTRGTTVAPEQQNIFWIPAHSTAPPDNFAPALIPALKQALLKTHAKGTTTRAMLCHEGTIHVATESWDMGWGCGYRNFLMACTALLSQTIQPLYFPLLESPGVRNLQIWIEDAWANGYDREGAEQLKHALVGKKKWIGTAELYVAFVSRGIPAQLVDFPGSTRGPKAVTEWIMNYFLSSEREKQQTNAFNVLREANPVLCTQRMPVILQHAGHSRTVVGVEVNKKGDINLLVFDPSNRIRKTLRRAALADHPSLPTPSQDKSPPSILQRILPSHGSGSRKRPKPDLPVNDSDREVKRTRNSSQGTGREDDLRITNKSADHPGRHDISYSDGSIDPSEVVGFFRVSQSKLRKSDKYQILWFPLDPPMSEEERWTRRVVTSEQVF